jgi:hypothetical protein
MGQWFVINIYLSHNCIISYISSSSVAPIYAFILSLINMIQSIPINNVFLIQIDWLLLTPISSIDLLFCISGQNSVNCLSKKLVLNITVNQMQCGFPSPSLPLPCDSLQIPSNLFPFNIHFPIGFYDYITKFTDSLLYTIPNVLFKSCDILYTIQWWAR